MSRKIVIKYDFLQSWEISSNMALFEFQFWTDLRQSSLPKVKIKEDILKIFHFTLPFFQAFFQTMDKQ